MPTVYGNTVESTFRSYLKYTVTETATNYKITVDDVGYDQVSSTYVYQGPVSESSNTLSYTLKLGSNTYTEYDSNVGYEQDASLIDWFEPYNKTITIAKTTSTQSVAVSFSFYTVKWIKSNINTGIGYEVAAATSTASATLTIPALGKPTVSLTAERDSSTDSTVKYTATIKSFSTDTISNCKLTVNGTVYTLTAGTVPSSGTLTITKTLTSQTLNRTTATLVATGKGGTSNTYTLTVPAAFYTLDIGNKGKEIAFGQSATTSESSMPSNGLFSCGMDANFQGNVSINNLGIKDYVVEQGTTDGWDYIKYASRKFTAWKHGLETYNCVNASGNTYYSDVVIWYLPFTIVDGGVANISLHQQCFASNVLVSTTAVNFRAIRGMSATLTNVLTNVVVHGTY